jgi:hypothetical protein
MSKIIAGLGCVLGVFASLSCTDKSDYLYLHPEPKHVSAEHKLTELVTDADLDILWVIDNSGSMANHQQTVYDNVDQFINNLVTGSTLHWKMGLISTDKGDSPYLGFRAGDEVDYSMADAADRFKAAVRKLGTNGDGTERMYDPVLSTFQNFPNFLRANTTLAIILVTDAPEQSSTSTQDFVNGLIKLKQGNAGKLLFYGFLNPSDWCLPTDDAWMWAGSKYEQLTKLVKGAANKLCDPNFGANLATLGTDLTKAVAVPRITLPDIPIPSSIRVYHGNDLIPGGLPGKGNYWQYIINLNAIIFSDLSFSTGDQDKVRVVYDIDDGTR